MERLADDDEYDNDESEGDKEDIHGVSSVVKSSGKGTRKRGSLNEEEIAAASNSEYNRAVLESIQMAKDCVNLFTWIGTMRSWSWPWFKRVKIKKGHESLLKDRDITSSEIITTNEVVFICTVCFHMKHKFLYNCFKVPTKGKKTIHTSNHNRHIETCHKELYKQLVKEGRVNKKKPTLIKNAVEKSVEKGNAKGERACRIPPKSVHISNGDGVSEWTGIQSPFQRISANLKTVPNTHDVASGQAAAACLAELHRLEVKCATNNNISQCAITDKNCPEWRDMIEYALFNGALITKNFTVKERYMCRHKFCGIRVSEYEYLLGAIYCHVVESREFYKNYVGKRVPFVTIGHDNWDSDDKDVLGVTVYWYNPQRKHKIRNAIGMCVVVDKSAVATVKQTQKILAGCGIEKEDIYRQVNNTTITTLGTGELLAGEKGACAMHSTQLVNQHATGHLKRAQQKKVTDEFPECDNLCMKARDCAFYLMNKKAKKRFAQYKKKMNTQGRVALRIFMSNDTRAAGVHMFFNSMVTSRWNLDLYWYEETSTINHLLIPEEFITIAELEAVLYPIALLTKRLESDKFGSNSVSFLYTLRCFQTYATQLTWYVADVDKNSNIKKTDWWHAGAIFPERQYFGKPVDWSKDQRKDGGLDKVYMVQKDRNDLKEIPQKIIERITKEFLMYNAKPTMNQLLAMACNPLTATIGVTELKAQSLYIQKKAVDPEIRPVACDYSAAMQKALLAEIKNVCSERIKHKEGYKDNREEEEESKEDEEDELSGKINLYEMFNIRKRRKKFRASQSTPVELEVQKFFASDINWYQQLVNQKCKQELFEVLAPQNSLTYLQNWETIAENFDIMKWWEDFGKIEYPRIYIIACLILPLPDSNASQERTFSSATWMDGKLNKCQSDATFQMKIILQQNSKFLDQTRLHVEEDFKKKLAEETKQMVEEAMNHRRKEYEHYKACIEQQVEEERKKVEENLKKGIMVEENILDGEENDDNIMMSGGFPDSDLNDGVDYDEEALEEFFEFESQKLD